MNEKFKFIRLPIVLVLLFFVGKLAMGAAGASYEAGNRVFSMVILQTHLALLWAAVGRRYQGYGAMDAALAVMMITFVSQILILSATASSYLTGIDTHFNYPEALGSQTPMEFGPAMVSRIVGLAINCVMTGVLGLIGWSLAGLIPKVATGTSSEKAMA